MAISDALNLRLRLAYRYLVNTAFLPMGVVSLDLRSDRFDQLERGGALATLRDRKPFYYEWHEYVHILQLVTCPYVFEIARQTAEIAQLTFRTRKGLQPSFPLIELKECYAALMAGFQLPVIDGFSAQHIVETHAVTQSLLWFAESDAVELVALANEIYQKSNSVYIGLLNRVASEIGEEYALKILPRLCFLSLQAQNPVECCFLYVETMKRDSTFLLQLSNATAREFFVLARSNAISCAKKTLTYWKGARGRGCLKRILMILKMLMGLMNAWTSCSADPDQTPLDCSGLPLRCFPIRYAFLKEYLVQVPTKTKSCGFPQPVIFWKV
jgi:hypothetical protein